jgi:acetyl esterase/lipase
MLDVEPTIAAIAAHVPIPTMSDEVLEAVRGTDLGGPIELSDRVTRTEHLVPGDPDIMVRVHRPVGIEGELPCFYAMHGGGMVIGSSSMDDGRFDKWCPWFKCVGVSVEYRLAPETPYPGPLEDCYRGLKWVYDNAAMLGVNRNHIGIGGTSAGGGLAAGLALLARDRGEVPVKFQMLDCPMIDDRQITPSSQMDGLLIWNRESNTYGWKSYLGDLYGTENVPSYAAPARATDLSGLPPAFVCVGNVDGFRDEDITYAMRLNQAFRVNCTCIPVHLTARCCSTMWRWPSNMPATSTCGCSNNFGSIDPYSVPSLGHLWAIFVPSFCRSNERWVGSSANTRCTYDKCDDCGRGRINGSIVVCVVGLVATQSYLSQ